MTYIQANFAGATPLEGPLVAGLVTSGALPDRLKAFAGQDWVQAFLEEETADSPFDAKGEQVNDALAGNSPSAGDDHISGAVANATHFVTCRENAVRLLAQHAGSEPWRPLLALALGIAFASLAIGVAADFGASAAARPHYSSVEVLPT
jgi:hypothetical protein